MIRRFLLRLLVSTLVILGVAYFSGGELLRVDSFRAAASAAVVLGLVNAFVRPVLKLLTLPLTVVTLGLFSFVLNAFFLYGVEALVPGFHTVDFVRTMIAAVAVSLGTSILGWIVAR